MHAWTHRRVADEKALETIKSNIMSNLDSERLEQQVRFSSLYTDIRRCVEIAVRDNISYDKTVEEIMKIVEPLIKENINHQKYVDELICKLTSPTFITLKDNNNFSVFNPHNL